MSTGSALDDRDLCLTVKDKLLCLMAVLAKHGYLARGEIERVVGKPKLVPDLESALTEAQGWKVRASQLAKDKEILETERSSAERWLGDARKNLEMTRRNEEFLKGELATTRRKLSNAHEEIDSLTGQIGELRSELVSRLSNRGKSSLADGEWDEGLENSVARAEALRGLVEAVEPLAGQIEFAAMDDRDLAEKLEAVRGALRDAHVALAE